MLNIILSWFLYLYNHTPTPTKNILIKRAVIREISNLSYNAQNLPYTEGYMPDINQEFLELLKKKLIKKGYAVVIKTSEANKHHYLTIS